MAPPSPRCNRPPLALLLALTAPAAAHAASTQFTLGAGATTYTSSWRGDYGAGINLRAGARFTPNLGVDVQISESYAAVDTRLNTGLSFGVTGHMPMRGVSPYARLFATHQHEEAWVSFLNAPSGALFGVGSGIRHRAGGGLSAGVELPLAPRQGNTRPVLFSNVNASWLPSGHGPTWQMGVDVGLGLELLP